MKVMPKPPERGSLPLVEYVREVYSAPRMTTGLRAGHFTLIAPDPMAGHRNVYSVIRVSYLTGLATCIGRELTLALARMVAKAARSRSTSARRLSPEEVAEIRQSLATCLDQGGYDYDRTDLLSHIEALRLELERTRLDFANACDVGRRTEAERDRLRAENHKLHEELVNKRDEVECEIAVALRGEGWPHAPTIAAWIERGDYYGERSSASPAKDGGDRGHG